MYYIYTHVYIVLCILYYIVILYYVLFMGKSKSLYLLHKSSTLLRKRYGAVVALCLSIGIVLVLLIIKQCTPC